MKLTYFSSVLRVGLLILMGSLNLRTSSRWSFNALSKNVQSQPLRFSRMGRRRFLLPVLHLFEKPCSEEGVVGWLAEVFDGAVTLRSGMEEPIIEGRAI